MANSSSSVDIDPEYIQFLLDPDLEFSCYFVVGNAELAPVVKIGVVRKMLAAHSEVFRTQLMNRQSHSKEPEKVTDVLPATFKNLLRFVYGFDTTSRMSFEDAQSMLFVADKYIMSRLKNKLTFRLMSLLDYTNICSLLTNPACSRVVEVNSEITRILQSQTDRVLSTPSFLSCCPDTFVKILEQEVLNVPELELWRAALKWAKNKVKSEDSKSLRQQLLRPLQHIRVCTLPYVEFCKEVAPTGILTDKEVAAVCVSHGTGNKPLTLKSVSNSMEVRKQRRAMGEVKYVKSAEQNIDLYQGDAGHRNMQQQGFQLKTHNLGVEITSLSCEVFDRKSCDFVVNIRCEEGATQFDTVALTNSGSYLTLGRENLLISIPISTKAKPVLLPPHSIFNITISRDEGLKVFERDRPAEYYRELTLKFSPYLHVYCTPVCDIFFKALTPQ